MDDDALVRQVLAGHNDAYAELVQRWAGRVVAVCHARLGRADLAEELAQEALVRGFEELPSLADPSRFGPWLAGIATNACRDWLKSRQNAQLPLSGAGAEPAVDAPPSAALERQDEIAQLMREVEALPEECRTVLLLFYYQKASYKELARMLDVSTATINARLTRARSTLRERMLNGRHDGGRPANDPETP
jgi:RNA polymerase sigma-70 factor (ECF subfamily)